MFRTRSLRTALALGATLLVTAPFAPALDAQRAVPPDAPFAALRWRMLGPFRAGRTKSAVGIPSQPNVFWMAVTNGGVWKTDDYGRTWHPVFDEQATGSIGAVEVAPSNPDIVYVGSGEGLHRPDLSTGTGIYKSTDAGKTWRWLGLPDAQQVPRIAVDPRDPDRILVAVLGHPYGPNTTRGIYRSTNGGASFERVLYKDENTGGADVVIDPSNPDVAYAVLWEARQGPWENAAWSGANSGLFRTTDGGTTWTQLAGGLPTTADGLGRIGIALAPSNPKVLYVTATAGEKSGVWRSDDAGTSWRRVTADARIHGRGDDFAALTVDPRDPETLYSMNVVAWKSTDGGRSWNALRGAPGGDDYQRLWINPSQPNTMLLVSDQGAVITVNGGRTWSSWYNQPTAQFYHVTADDAWPYRLCGGQQESGSACVPVRSDDGRIDYRHWRPVGASEYSYVAPDPLNPDIVYGGTVTRYDRRTGQVQDVSPNAGWGRRGAPPGDTAFVRGIRTMPILFSPTNKRKLYYGTNAVWQTVDGGATWRRISGDLSRPTWTAPANVGKWRDHPASKPTRRGVVYTIAPSPVDSNTIWAGTDDGLIHVTRDNGKTWRDVTPPQVGPWAKISLMDAGHRDANVAYAAVNTFRLDDLRPHVFRTRDGGRTWTEIVAGIDSGAIVNVVKEDPKRPGLLFAGTETQVWFSLDDGDSWQPLRLNMPAISIRDLVVKDDDLAVATHGRGLWVLDDITPLRQWADALAAKPAHLFAPAVATRVRYSMYPDTPVPPDEPYAENPPDGAVLDYVLARDVQRVELDVLDAAGRIVRHYASTDEATPPRDLGNWPRWWFRPPQRLGATTGHHRFTWDLHHERPTTECSLPISATPRNTKCEPEGPWVPPGRYTVRLTYWPEAAAGDARGTSITQPLVVRMDPRVRSPAGALALQYRLSLALHDASVEAMRRATRLKASGGEGESLAAAYSAFVTQARAAIDALQASDAPPTRAMVEAAEARLGAYRALEARWAALGVRADGVR